MRERTTPAASNIPEDKKMGKNFKLNITHCPAFIDKARQNTTIKPQINSTGKRNIIFFFEKDSFNERLKMCSISSYFISV